MDIIKYSSPHITEEDIEAVSSVLRSGYVAGRGEVVEKFEEGVSRYTGYKYAISVNSATSGLFVLSHILKEEIKKNERLLASKGYDNNRKEVVVPALTFVATMNAPLSFGLRVSVRDVCEDWSLQSMSNIPRIFVSYAGTDKEVSQDGLLIRDDAHRFVPGMGVGDISLGSVISTHGIKSITTGEGGVILTNHTDVYRIARNLCDHGHYGDGLGLNFRMSSVNAALGSSQLKRATEYLELRRGIANYYLGELQDIATMQTPYDENHCWHIFPVVIHGVDRNKLRERMEKMGVLTQIHYEPLYSIANTHPLRGQIDCGSRDEYYYSEDMWHHGFSLPIHNAMTMSQAERVVTVLKNEYERLL